MENSLKGLQEEKNKLEQEKQQLEITKQDQVNEVKEISTETQTQSTKDDTSPANNAKSANEDISHIYILNKNTKVFHEVGCSSVSKMKDSNKEEFSGSRDSVINRGYKPCSKCNP